MSNMLKKDFLVGALLSEIVRQQPCIILRQNVINEILSRVEEICNLFDRDVEQITRLTK